MVIRLMEATQMPLERARDLLLANNWDYAKVANKIKEDERMENLAMQAMSRFGFDYDKAKQLLQENGGNLEALAQPKPASV